jgi:hypothetical protein
MTDTPPGNNIRATLYTRISPQMFTALFDLAELGNLSMATTVDALIAKTIGEPHIHAAALASAITRYRKGERHE